MRSTHRHNVPYKLLLGLDSRGLTNLGEIAEQGRDGEKLGFVQRAGNGFVCFSLVQKLTGTPPLHDRNVHSLSAARKPIPAQEMASSCHRSIATHSHYLLLHLADVIVPLADTN